MKKSKKLSLKKIKIANVSKLYSLHGGMMGTYNSAACIPTVNTFTAACPPHDTTTSETTSHTQPHTFICMSANCTESGETTNNGDTGNNTNPQHSIEIC
ncbi:hypothetical protein [Kordia sp.]|uniref:hypothetical protein n=1 Tax=Kordia sp. TaxID=1965332 RepID=UPI003B5BC32E